MPIRPSIHTIKVSLRYLKPPVWRRLQVASTTSLAQLHHIEVEAIDRADPALTYPRCVTGRRACPPALPH
jgi:Plasmid pRiA4b ORF-3-like protein